MEELVLEVNKTNLQWDSNPEKMVVHDWLFIRSALPVTTIMISYWLFVLKLGPMYMKNKEPLDVKKYMVAYNIFQILFSMCITGLSVDFMIRYSLFPSICPEDAGNKGLRLELVKGAYIYMIAKITELLDTVFFVLKKNNRQITFLHVYHHSIALIITWIAIKIDSINPSAIFIGACNGFVHVIMYTYYGLSAFPSMAKRLWWKKYITTLQLVQFCVIMLHHFVAYRIAKCDEFNIIFLAIIFHLFLFVYLFLDFYIKTYKEKQNLKTDPVKNTSSNDKKIK